MLKIVLPDNPVVAYSAANINLTGIGVYDSQNGNEFDFRGIASANNSLTVTLDAGNNTVLLTLDVDVIVDDLPQATTTQRGVGETATDAEAIAKASITTFVTPSNFAAMASSTTFAGLVELATNAETQAGLSSSLAVTPAGLASVTSAQLVTAVTADSVSRAALAPAFDGQFLSQLDTETAWVGASTSAGDWNPLFTFGTTQTVTSATTTVNLNTSSTNFVGNGSMGWVNVDASFNGGNVLMDGATLSLGSASTQSVDFFATSLLIGGVPVPAASVITTAGLGSISSSLVNTFLSTANTQTGYTAFVNGAVLRTCDTTTVTLPQLAQIVGTLIEDLKSVQLPAT